MASDLSLTLKYDDKPPKWTRGEGVLFAAKQMLKILHEIERAQGNAKPKIVWDINIYSFSDSAVIEFRAAGGPIERSESTPVMREALSRAADIKPPRKRKEAT